MVTLSLNGSFADAKPAYAHFIDVGIGDATLVEFPCGTVLIDAGGDKKGPDRLTPYLKSFFASRLHLKNTLDLIVITHAHYDHNVNLPAVLKSFRVRNLLWNGRAKAGQSKFADLLQQYPGLRHRVLTTDRIPVDGLTDGQIDPVNCSGTDPKIRALWGGIKKSPESWKQKDYRDKNNHSITIRIDYGRASMLFTGDLETRGLQALVRRSPALLDVGLLKIGHHGFRSGTTRKFVRRVTPEIAVLSREYPRPWHRGTYRFYQKHVSKMRFSPLAIDVWYIPEGKRKRDYPKHDAQGVKLNWGLGRGKRAKRRITKAIYWTGMEGTIIVRAGRDGRLEAIKQ